MIECKNQEELLNVLRSYCLALYLILVENNLVEDDFDKYFNRATHILEQKDTEAQEKAIANMDEKEKRMHDALSMLFGQRG